MAFVYAYSLSDEEVVIKDFPLAAGQTPARGDLVILNGSGQVTASGNNPTTVLGCFESQNFQGLVASGQPFAATTVTQNSQSTTTAKVRVSPTAVYRVPLKTAAAAPTIGTKYGCASGTAPSGANAVIDTANTATGAIYQVVDYDSVAKNCFVIITARSMF
jgi:hypothetical protein